MVLLSRSDEKYKMHLTMTALDSLTAAALLKTTERQTARRSPSLVEGQRAGQVLDS